MENVLSAYRCHPACFFIPPEESLLVDRYAHLNGLPCLHTCPCVASEGLDRAFRIAVLAYIKLDNGLAVTLSGILYLYGKFLGAVSSSTDLALAEAESSITQAMTERIKSLILEIAVSPALHVVALIICKLAVILVEGNRKLSGRIDIISVIVEPIIEVVGSLLLGLIMGLLFSFFEKFFHSRSKRLAMSVTFVLFTVALSMLKFEFFGIHIAFSSLLVCMMLGTVFCNVCDFSEELMDRIDRWTAPLFILFFVISGSQLELSVFTDVAIVAIGLVYIIARSAGKYFGAATSAKAVKCDSTIVKYLGITLLPQAGVALGMAIKAEQELGEHGAMVANITLFAVLIYELIGPMLTKISLIKAGEIKTDGAISAREEAKKAKERKHLHLHTNHHNNLHT